MTPELEQATPGSQCLSEDELLAFAGGHLSSTRRSDAHLHLDECPECQQLLTEAVQGLAMATTHGFGRAQDVAWNVTFRAGSLVGRRYVVRRFIARGGMGEVYEAFDQDLQERIALKTVTSTACDSPNAVKRLKAEVQLARRVSHPHVCRIYDFGTHVVPTSGVPVSFLTMEFADGVTLGQHIRDNGALPVTQAVALARQMLEGLRAAHAAGILHRDFKSENVILRQEASGLSPLILDFGLARALEEGSKNSSTEHGLVGTFAYIAPEQLEGKPHTTASDLYSFGVVFFEVLTGELPYKCGSSPVASTLDRLRRPALPPSSINPVVPQGLDEIVLQCLERTPSRRLRNADEALARLDALARGEAGPVQRRQRRWLLLVAAVGAMTALGLWATERGSSRNPAVQSAVVEAPAAPAARNEAPAQLSPVADGAKVAPAAPPPFVAPVPSVGREPARKRPAVAAAMRLSEPAPASSTTAPSDVAEPPQRELDPGWENPFRKNH